MGKFLRETAALAGVIFLLISGTVILVAGLVTVVWFPFAAVYAALALKGSDALITTWDKTGGYSEDLG